ncbi:SPOR domain-containing protein [Limoniibacter endophyticus]|uniref:SPOR domain-containing protein n=1 Tax=Limoniibacter endophyticus TaxID=1565040 RepID=UPI001FCE9678|nr:SPOR domain-containing protein [Limoniibacter endophyticus]
MAIALVAVIIASPASANSKYAAIIVDANTGKTLHASSANELRYPASLTKMMTLYLLFEQMKAGHLDLSSRISFSANASSEQPTKLGVKPGNSITVETAINALVIRSANDVATAVGEKIAGSETAFAQLMTRKARQLGMTKTVFRNAHGLPNSQQVTTAADMAKLGIALREHFPQYYKFFSARSFTYGKTTISTHNRLVTSVKGVDGIKTGYTRASGFNLVSSMQDDQGRSVVGVVLGGTSTRARDDQMRALLAKYMPAASKRDRGPLIASATGPAFEARVAGIRLPKNDIPTPDFRPGTELASNEGGDAIAALMAATNEQSRTSNAPTVQAYAAPLPSARPTVQIDGIQTAATVRPKAPIANAPSAPVQAAAQPAVAVPQPQPASNGWVVQIGSLPSESDAQAVLATTSQKAATILADASAFTSVFEKDGSTFYRARFGGFNSKEAAWNACSALKKRDISCYAVQQ